MSKRFANLNNISNTKSMTDFWKWRKERKLKEKNLTLQISEAEHKEIEKIKANRSKFSITWIGHSTFLIQMNGLNILTDPVWDKSMGLEKRLIDPGIPINELPPIDIVFISHGHYDHLSWSSIRKLKGDITFFAPAGLKAAFQRKGYKNVKEMNWWDNSLHESLHISFVPAQHWTKRTLFDKNTSHWGGWIIKDVQAEKSVYFVGDTGYFKGFKDIADRFELDVILMPIGAYEPEWFMSVDHINPEDAVKAFTELNGKLFIPMHYGTYRLADDTGPEALERLQKAWDDFSLKEEQLLILKIGESAWFN